MKRFIEMRRQPLSMLFLLLLSSGFDKAGHGIYSVSDTANEYSIYNSYYQKIVIHCFSRVMTIPGFKTVIFNADLSCCFLLREKPVRFKSVHVCTGGLCYEP